MHVMVVSKSVSHVGHPLNSPDISFWPFPHQACILYCVQTPCTTLVSINSSPATLHGSSLSAVFASGLCLHAPNCLCEAPLRKLLYDPVGHLDSVRYHSQLWAVVELWTSSCWSRPIRGLYCTHSTQCNTWSCETSPVTALFILTCQWAIWLCNCK